MEKKHSVKNIEKMATSYVSFMTSCTRDSAKSFKHMSGVFSTYTVASSYQDGSNRLFPNSTPISVDSIIICLKFLCSSSENCEINVTWKN